VVEDLYLVGYGFVRGFLSGVLTRFGIVISDMTLDFLAVILGHYLKTRPGWQGIIGKIMYSGGLVALGIEIGQSTGARVANELFASLQRGAQATGAQAGAVAQPTRGGVFTSPVTGRQIRM
jgi:acetyl-CoA acetyltransferase